MDWMVASPPNTAALNRPKQWWEKRWLVAAVILATMIPLLYPPLPPLVDLLGHMGRYRVSLDLGTSPTLAQYYAFEWKIVGNLGVDLLVVPLAGLFGLELATKLIVLTIPPLTAAGMLWVAREVHYRLPPTASFALPFITGHHFLFGFVNYALSMAFAFLAFGLWLRLGRMGKGRLRAALFVPISILIWLTHTFGWGMLGLLAFASECIRQHDKGRGWLMSAPRAAFHCLSLAAPLEGEVAVDCDGAARPLALVRSGFGRRDGGGAAVRDCAPQTGAVANAAVHGDDPAGGLRHPAAHHLRLGLCRHADRAVHLGNRAAGHPL
jgi:hypothetical protein